MYNVSFIGLGKLGLECAEAIVDKGIPVTGYDIKERTSNKVSIVSDIKDAVTGMDFIFIAVETPTMQNMMVVFLIHLSNKDFDYSHVKDVLGRINNVITKDQTIVLISTVLPGTCREQFIPMLGFGTNFIYNPYLIAMGTTTWDMLNPEMIIIGNAKGKQDDVTANLVDFYNMILEKNNTRFEIGTWDEAECIKIFYNTFISAKLSLVNMIQDVAERNGNINCDVVANAITNCTQRIISPMYMKPGMGDGGPCHPRDNIALRYLAEKLDLGYDLFDAIMTAREVQAKRLAEKLISYDLPVVILGKAFKPDVEFTNGSYGMLVGHYVNTLAPHLDLYYDKNPNADIPCTYLLGHRSKHYDFDFNNNSVTVDPWREFETDNKNIKEIVYYGDTRY